MTKEQEELLDSMVEGFLQDVRYQFDLDGDHQASKLVSKSIERLNEEV